MATAMVDTARSCTSFGGVGQPYAMEVNTETRLGEDVLSRKFVKELEHYYDKANIQDKAKCLELITSVQLGEELKQQVKQTRPKSAMPAFGADTSYLSPYQTSYTRDYPPKVDWGVRAIRPMTSQGYATQLPYSQPPGPTTYDVEFHQKFQRPASPERAGTASGNRNNRPHPAQGFMVWKFPRKNRYHKDPEERISEDLTNQKLNEITKRLCHSVYQNDYLGIPQGFQVKSAFNLPPDWKDNVAYDMDSNNRMSYQYPIQQSELVVPNTRYGSNFKKPIASTTIIPTANKRYVGVNTRTTYDRHYNDNAGPVVEQIRDVGRKLGAEALKKHYNQSFGNDKDLIGKLIDEYGAAPSPMPAYNTPAPSPSPYDRPVCPTPPSNPRPATVINSKSPPLTQRPGSQRSGFKGRSQSAAPKTNRSVSRSSSPAYKPRPGVPAATAIMLPSPAPHQHYPVHLPTSPPSMPFTPPIHIS